MAYLLFAVVAALAWVILYVWKGCFYSPRNRQEDPYERAAGVQYDMVADIITDCVRVMDKTPCEWVWTKSHDGLLLWGRYYHTADFAPTVIAFHGYRGNALRDGAAFFAISRQLGFNILVPDQRAHARSEGKIISFGIKERFDVLSWARYIGRGAPILLAGLSMGAATVLMASDLDLPKNVCCILADCPFDSPAGIIQKVLVDRKFPKKMVYPFVKATARLCGFHLESASAIHAVQNAKVPVMLIHGDDDRFVPCQMSKAIANACAAAVQLDIIPGAGHGLCYMTDPVRYEEAVRQFLKKIPALRSYLQP